MGGQGGGTLAAANLLPTATRIPYPPSIPSRVSKNKSAVLKGVKTIITPPGVASATHYAGRWQPPPAAAATAGGTSA